MTKISAVLGCAAVLFGFLFARAAYADDGNKNSDLAVQLKIEAGCSLEFTAGGVITFRAFQALDAPMSEEGKFTLKCTKGDTDGTAQVTLSGGSLHEADTPADRYLYHDGAYDAAKRLKLNIYQDKAGNKLWGEGADAYFVPISAAGGASQELIFRVELPAQPVADLPVGAYSNSFRATVTYPLASGN